MADNTPVNTNTGAPGAVNVPVATDDIGGVAYQRVKMTYGADGVATDVEAGSPLPISEPDNVVSAGNSTTTPLGSGAVFLGSSVDLLGHTAVACSVFSDVDSAASGVEFQFSPDGTNWDARVKNTFTADGTVGDIIVRPHDRFFRLRYVNGGTAQGVFRLQTILYRKPAALADSCGVDHPPQSGDDAMIVKAVIAGKTSAGGGSYVDVKVNPSGSLVIGGGATAADGFANPTDAQSALAHGMVYNGSTWDRIRAAGTNIDAEAVLSTGVIHTHSHLTCFNGTTWDRVRGTIANGIDVDVTRVQGTVTVDGSGVTQPVSAASLPLPTGAASEFTLSGIDAEVSAINVKTPSLGQTVKAGSVPVTLASDQGALSVSGPLTDAQLRASAVPVSVGSIALPTGAATETTLAAINTKTPALGAPNDVALSTPVNVACHEADYMPGYSGPSATPGGLNVDPEGALLARASVLTDEGTVRVNFANSSLSISIGSPARSGNFFTGGSIGNGIVDLHVGDFVKFDADAESAWAEVVSILGNVAEVAAYTGGTTSGAASRSKVRPYTGAGGAIAVASGQCTIASGNTASSVTGIIRPVDYAPLVWRASISLSQRIANQDFYAGLREDAATPRWFARFRFNGTANTAVICETGWNPTGAPSASETQTTTATLGATYTTAVLQEYRVELLTESVRFYVANTLVAEHTRVIPSQHDEMAMVCEWVNGTTPASSTTATIDYETAKNHNKVEIGVMSQAEQIVATPSPFKEWLYTQAGVIAINTDLLVIDCNGLSSLQFQCLSMGTTGVVTPQWSNDPAFSVTATGTFQSSANATATTFNSAALYSSQVWARYVRFRLTTATTAGTTTIRVIGGTQPIPTFLATQPVSGTVTANLGTGGTGATALGKAEDAVAASGDTGVAVWGVRRDTLFVSSSATGDYNEQAVNQFGALNITDFRLQARTYRAAFQVASVASATDIFAIFGHASTKIVVTSIEISGVATSASQADILVLKRSTANTGGSFTAPTAVPLDSADAAAVATLAAYTANPTPGTLVGAVGRQHLSLSTASSAGESGHCFCFGERGKGVLLNGTAQGLTVNLNGVTITGGTFDIQIEWYEY